MRIISKWTPLKENGFSAIPRGESTVSFSNINHTLQEKGIHIVPVGELECFIKEVGGHGPNWTNKVLETHPDLNDTVYDGIKEFIKSINL